MVPAVSNNGVCLGTPTAFTREGSACLRCLRKYFVGWWAVIVSVVSVPLLS